MESENASDDSSAVASVLPLASGAQQPYVSELLSFTLDRLHKEPELLQVDAERLQRQVQKVVVRNYRAFIAASNALLVIRDQVPSIDNHLESLIGEIPKLMSGCTEFVESAEEILEKRKMNQTLLANHSTSSAHGYVTRYSSSGCRSETDHSVSSFSASSKTSLKHSVVEEM